MALIGYSPWQDAANYGAGLGNTLGEILLRVPQMRAQAALAQQQNQRDAQAFPLEQQYKQAQISAEQERAGASRAQQDYNRARIAGLSNQQDMSSIMPVVQKLMSGQKPEPEELQAASSAMLSSPQGRTMAMKMLEQVTKPQPQHVTRPGDVVMQGGQPVYTNNVPLPLSGQNLLSILESGQTNAPQFHAAQQMLNQRLQLPQMSQQTNAMPQAGTKVVTPEIAAQFLQQANGNKDVARQLARQAGFTF